MYSSITLMYTSLLALLLIGLSYNVVRLRRQFQVGIGTGSVQPLERAVRAHANFCEYVPIALLLLVLIEIGGDAPGWALHVLGALLLFGRLAHAVGLSRSAGATRARVIGTVLTWSVLLVGAGMGLAVAVRAALG